MSAPRPRAGWAILLGICALLGALPATAGTFDTDSKADVAIFRPSAGTWYIRNSSDLSMSAIAWGDAGDNVVPGDYDGDGRTDVAIFRPSAGTWHIRNSSDASMTSVAWGGGNDRPAPGDYDGDGKTDIAVFRPSEGAWYIRNSSNLAMTAVLWGEASDIVVPGDYDGDGKTDIAVFRPSTGAWYIRNSYDGTTSSLWWGENGDRPLPGDYDGDGRADVAIFRPSTATWHIRNSSDGSTTSVAWGADTDRFVPADYDGDKKIDIAVFRPSAGEWHIRNSSDLSTATISWGGAGDVPLADLYARPPAGPRKPDVLTLDPTGVSSDNATLNGSADPNSRSTTAWFEWGTDPALTSYAETPRQSIGSGNDPVAVQAAIDNLSANTAYYFRACAANNAGEKKGPIVAFSTATPFRAGPDAGQYFDRAVQPPGSQNYADNASHPLRGLTTSDEALVYRAQGSENCLRCHYGSGPARATDECLKCHFENRGSGDFPASLDPTRHGNGTLELSAVSADAAPASAFSISSPGDYDAWCLQCHDGGSTTLGNRSVSGKTVVGASAFANGRHRSVGPDPSGFGILPDGPLGCIYCHQPHGTMNTRLVRNNPVNRWFAGGLPSRFRVFPSDNLGSGAYGTRQDVVYRSRTDEGFADAEDDHRYCNKACHGPTLSQNKDRLVVRDNTTGIYILSSGGKKQYVTKGIVFTIDNPPSRAHGHNNDEIVSTDNMAQYWSANGGPPGPSFYRYPGTAGANPAQFTRTENLASPLPFFPDFGDGDRDFTNGYLNMGRIRYRLTCSTCHDPHGTLLSNGASSDSGYPDLRLPKKNPNDLCVQCHR